MNLSGLALATAMGPLDRPRIVHKGILPTIFDVILPDALTTHVLSLPVRLHIAGGHLPIGFPFRLPPQTL